MRLLPEWPGGNGGCGGDAANLATGRPLFTDFYKLRVGCPRARVYHSLVAKMSH
jgi:hypothetical protein